MEKREILGGTEDYIVSQRGFIKLPSSPQVCGGGIGKQHFYPPGGLNFFGKFVDYPPPLGKLYAHLCSSQSMIFGLSGPPDIWWLATPLISPTAYLKGATERAKKHRSRKIKRKSFPRHLACGPIKCECKFFRPPIQRNHQKILSISSKTICMNLKGLSVQLQVITFLAIGS